MTFEPVPQRPDLPALEEQVLELWRDGEVFRRTVAGTEGGAPFRFYDGPPTANGRPGVHHVEARVFKDVFPRYRTMKGEHALRKAGWDCHGIPVELEVERELGFTRKRQIEEYGVAEFNARCRASVTRYVREFEELTERTGYWVDTADAYWTMSPEYVQSVWWSLKTLWERGLIYQDRRVVPYCPRCGTALSDHEVAQGYREVDDPSIYVRFPLLSGPLGPEGENASLLVWTTMPWTLVPATAAVVSEDIRYVLARGGRAGGHLVVLAADRVEAALGEGAEILREVAVAELAGSRYQAPFDFVGPGSADDPEGDPASWRIVVVDDFVETGQGTGIVHTGAAFGEDDFRVAKDNGLPVVVPVTSEGRFDERAGPYAGMFIRDADALIIDSLRENDLLTGEGTYRHTFPFCWRCDSPLFYYAKPSWFIATTRFRETFLADNAEVDWRPAHIRDGRYGDWLANNVDWALSRERYWGTPLPLWRCDGCDEIAAVGSLAELGELAGRDLSALDPHRPYVDDITLGCRGCGGTMTRVPEVIDAWYDSGAMPFAQFGYPHAPGSEERFAAAYPADYICEAIDQTRGWFYSLQAVGTLLFGHTAYVRSLCLGHIVDEDGRKMSKSAGNVLDPWDLVGRYGADALRWVLLVEGNPWQSRRVGDKALEEATRKVLLTLWNTYYFFVTYARLDGWTPDRAAPPPAERPVLDRYVLAELADVTAAVDAALADFDVTAAGRRLSGFVSDLSNWYLRCSRDRFWNTDPDAPGGDSGAAFATLHTCLVTLARLLAPVTPFLAETLYQNLARSADPGAPASVHMTPFPAGDTSVADDGLRAAVEAARRLVTLGREARSNAGIGVRQPLRRAIVAVPGGLQDRFGEVKPVIAAELNVKEIQSAGAGSGPVSHAVKPNFRALGATFGKRTKAVAEAIRAADPEVLAAAMDGDGPLEVVADGETVALEPDHLQVSEVPVVGWQVNRDGPYSIALDVAVDPGLRREGLARELIRLVNDLRKRHGFGFADRVAVLLAVKDDPEGDIAVMLTEHAPAIARNVLADELSVGPVADSAEQVPLGAGHIAIDLR
ncbi:MAG: isoleucine--tRNA ligase [Streptosporangiales bacterium]|nr:isoleucine--tRNA ligase [Streptosporangiales bacterium]